MRFLLFLALLLPVDLRGQVTSIPSASSGGAGATDVSGISDLKVTRTSSTVLTLTGGNILCGDTVYTISNTTFTWSSGAAGTVFIAIDCLDAGQVVVGRGSVVLTGSGFNQSAETTLSEFKTTYPKAKVLASVPVSGSTFGTVVGYRNMASSDLGIVPNTGLSCDFDSNGLPRCGITSEVIVKGTTQTFTVKIWGTGGSNVLQDTDDEASIWNNQTGGSITITSVTCESDTGTPSIQLQKDDGSAANILSSNLSCATTPASTTTFASGENVLASGDRLDHLMITAGGSAHWVSITVTYTRN